MRPRTPLRARLRTRLTAAVVTLVSIAGFTSVTGVEPAAAREPSNSIVIGANNIHLADLDGTDGAAELVQVAGSRLFVTEADYEGTPVLHHYLNATIFRVVVGDFRAQGRDHLCPVLSDNSIRCFALSDDGTELWWGFTQANFIAANERVIVGDFTGNGTDDLLLHNPSTGGLRLFTRGSSGFVRVSFVPGNLGDANLVGKRIYAGDFGQSVGRADLLVVDPANGAVSRYDSVTDGGNTTFWWAFSTNGGAVASSEQLNVANISGGRDGVVARDTGTGRVRLLRAEWANGKLAASPVTTGQLPVTTDNGRFVFGRVAAFAGERGDASRDDAVFYNFTRATMTRTDARFDGSAYTYWYAYTKATPTNTAGWPTVDTRRTVVLPCRFSDKSTVTPFSTTYLRDFFNVPVGQFLADSSVGAVAFNVAVAAWRTTAISTADYGNLERSQVIEECRKAHGVDASRYRSLIAVYNDDKGYGASGNNVLLDPSHVNVAAAGHEVLHTYGQHEHTYDDSGTPVNGCDWCNAGEYKDPYDVMSYASSGYGTDETFATGTTTATVRAWPELNAAYRNQLGYLSARRVTTLTHGTSTTTRTVSLAAVERPEGAGALLVRIPYKNTDAPSLNYVAIEYREKRGWDRNIPASTVLIRSVINGRSYLRNASDPAYGVGETWSGHDVAVKVVAINPVLGRATVRITY